MLPRSMIFSLSRATSSAFRDASLVHRFTSWVNSSAFSWTAKRFFWMPHRFVDFTISSPSRRNAGLTHLSPARIAKGLHISIAFRLTRNAAGLTYLSPTTRGKGLHISIAFRLTRSAAPVAAVAACCSLVLPHDRIRLDSRRASWKSAQWYSHCECLICDGNGGAFDITSSTNDRSLTRASSTVGGKSRSCSASGNLRKYR